MQNVTGCARKYIFDSNLSEFMREIGQEENNRPDLHQLQVDWVALLED